MLSCCVRQLLSRNMFLRPAVTLLNRYTFSEFDTRDDLELQERGIIKSTYKPYLRMKAMWEKPLAKKRLRQQRIRKINAERKPVPDQEPKLVVHNAAAGIEYPVPASEYFVVAEIDGRQFKIQEDCRITLDNRNNLKLNEKVVWGKVLLAATKDFTLLGRPYLPNSSIEATVEQKLRGRKIIVFKKLRRKQYKRSYGFRAKMTVLRVTRINFSLTNKELERAVNLE